MNTERIRDYFRAYHIREHYRSLKRDQYCFSAKRWSSQYLKEREEMIKLGYPVK